MSVIDPHVSAQRLYDELVRRQPRHVQLESVADALDLGRVRTSVDRFLVKMRERVLDRQAVRPPVAPAPDGALQARTTEELVSQLKSVSGTDDRRDLFKVRQEQEREVEAGVLHPRSPSYLANARSVACIAIDQMLEETADGGFLVHFDQTLGESMGLCRNEFFHDQPVVGKGTAFLVAPDCVLTAHHVANSADFLDGLRVFFDFMLDTDPAPRAVPRNWKLPAEAVHEIDSVIDEDPVADWCLLKLKRASTRPPLKIAAAAPALHEDLYMIGFPGGIPMKLADKATITSLQVTQQGRFACDLDAFGGNSGSPVFSSRTHEVVGMLQSGNKDYDFITTGECKQVVTAPSMPELALYISVVRGLA